jgi:hypothetical protein
MQGKTISLVNSLQNIILQQFNSDYLKLSDLQFYHNGILTILLPLNSYDWSKIDDIKIIRKMVLELFEVLYTLIIDTRSPWRCDYKIDEERRKIKRIVREHKISFKKF